VRRITVAKDPKNHRKTWSEDDLAKLRAEAAGNTPTRVLGIHLGRTPAAIQAKAAAIELSLKPVNQRPYGTAKKGKK
jgi:hypothetical protein